MSDLITALAGAWSGSGEGHYPTIDPFGYEEEVVFEQPPGKPFLAYRQRTRHVEDGRPLHTESGYLRVSDGHVEFLVAQPTGIVEVYEGPENVDGDALVFDLQAATVGLSATAKRVSDLRRRFRLAGDALSYDFWMAHEEVPQTHHLHAELVREGGS